MRVSNLLWALLLAVCVAASGCAVTPTPDEAPATAAGSDAQDEPGDPRGEDPVYVVKRGDTLATIARQTVGASAAWQIIAARNGVRDPASLRPGQRLRIPADLISGAGQSVVRSAPAERGGGERAEPEPAERGDLVIQGSYYPREVYSAPNTTSPIVTRVPPGARLTYVGKEGRWYEVTTRAGSGYVRAEYVRLQ